MKKKGITWRLTDVMKESDFDIFHKNIKSRLQDCLSSISNLTPEIKEKDFKKEIALFSKLLEESKRVCWFAELYSDTHINQDRSSYFTGQVKEIEILVHDIELILTSWLMGLKIKGMKRLDDANAKRLFKVMPELKFFFENLKKKRKFTLSEKIERIISRKDTYLKEPLLELYEMLLNDFRFEVKTTRTGKPKVINSEDELFVFIRSPNPDVRRSAYKSLLGEYKKNINKLYTIYQSLVRDWNDNFKIRKYPSPISFRNFENFVEDETVKTLTKVCTENRFIYQEYFKLKARELKQKKLRRYDIYAPIKKKEKKYTFKESKRKVLEVFKEFDLGFYKNARKIFDDNHIDYHPRKHKISGAYSLSINSKFTPYILLNYTGTTGAMLTMAHELGHGVHAMYSKKHSILVQDEPLPLAETASTFSEMLMFERLLDEINDKDEKKSLLFDRVAESFSTISRQNYFIKFELLAHELIPKGISAEELSNIYLKTQLEQFGNSVSMTNEFKYEWPYLSHIFWSPFYCYAYNFGDLLSLALYSIYKEEGTKFVKKFTKILAAGGSEKPSILLNKIGININSEKFWQGSFQIIQSWVNLIREMT
ncbi:M3 family oligoendopeptidase [Candidatus Dependentiae bacterium]|nr:M3 family oligoendopeptidase [Candidatus Dependentiae bacterium]